MALEIARRLVGGVWKTDTADESAGGPGGGSQPWEVIEFELVAPDVELILPPVFADDKLLCGIQLLTTENWDGGATTVTLGDESGGNNWLQANPTAGTQRNDITTEDITPGDQIKLSVDATDPATGRSVARVTYLPQLT